MPEQDETFTTSSNSNVDGKHVAVATNDNNTNSTDNGEGIGLDALSAAASNAEEAGTTTTFQNEDDNYPNNNSNNYREEEEQDDNAAMEEDEDDDDEEEESFINSMNHGAATAAGGGTNNAKPEYRGKTLTREEEDDDDDDEPMDEEQEDAVMGDGEENGDDDDDDDEDGDDDNDGGGEMKDAPAASASAPTTDEDGDNGGNDDSVYNDEEDEQDTQSVDPPPAAMDKDDSGGSGAAAAASAAMDDSMQDIHSTNPASASIKMEVETDDDDKSGTTKDVNKQPDMTMTEVSVAAGPTMFATSVPETGNGGLKAEDGGSVVALESTGPNGGAATTTAAFASTKKATNTKAPTSAPAPATAAAAAPAVILPILRGTLSYDLESRRHQIRGMWNYENATTPPQRFDYVRHLSPDEDPKELPKDGEFHGSFSLVFPDTKEGVPVERTKAVQESGVQIKFVKMEDGESNDGATGGSGPSYRVEGKGINEYGTFSIVGTAKPTPHDDDQFAVELRKAYILLAVSGGGKKSKTKKKKKNIQNGLDSGADADPDALPPPSRTYSTGVTCLRGKIVQENLDELGGIGETIVLTRISGMWAAGLDIILADPSNDQGHQSPFELEHKGSESKFPVSGRYSGHFKISGQRIEEKDVSFRFRKNNAGYYNLEGKGASRLGKYTMSGTLTNDNVITIFRHFLQKKIKLNTKASGSATLSRPITSAPPPINAPGQARRPSKATAPASFLSMDDVEVPNNGTEKEPMTPPMNGQYGAVSRGVIRTNDDGSLSCEGKWAATREHLNEASLSSAVTLRLESHFALAAIKKSADASGGSSQQFPLDSDQYKGSFKMKKTGGRGSNTVVDKQIVLKFIETSAMAYNVYGKGVNEIGTFTLFGTLIMQGKTAGQMELYRLYPPTFLASPPASSKPKTKKSATSGLTKSALPPIASNGLVEPTASSMLPGRPQPGIGRRESTRTLKVPSRLEEDDPGAQLAKTMNKCSELLRIIRDKDIALGAFFNKPVDPIAMNIPNYYNVIKEPMDLETLSKKMEAGQVKTPEEFSRLGQLIFQNAINFNSEPTHAVHQAARQMLVFFNARFQGIERQTLARSADGGGKKGGKNADNKRKREAIEEVKTPRRRRLKEVKEMESENERCLHALVSAAPTGIANSGPAQMPVTRHEFNLMLNMIQKLQQQLVKTHTAVAEMSSDAPDRTTTAVSKTSAASSVPTTRETAAPPPKKKAKKKPDVAKKPAAKPAVQVVAEEEKEALTSEEQIWLTESINALSEDRLMGVIEIIRNSDNYKPNDDDEIDLEIDQLDAVTQRNLFNFVKAGMTKKAKTTKKKKSPPRKAAVERSPVAAAPAYSPKAGTGGGDFFDFQKGSDSESDGEINESSAPAPAPAAGPRAAGGKDFRLGGLGEDESDDDDDDDDGGGNFASWNIAKLEAETAKKGGDEDDAWGAAREEAMAAKAREEDKKKREEKLQAEAEQQKKQRLAEAVAHGEEIKAQRQAEEEELARLQEEKEREAEEERQKAREDARKQVQSVEQTVDLDAERDLMKQLEESYLDKEMGGASPSSDFGF